MKKIMKKILLSVIMLFAFTSCGLLDILDSGPQVSTVSSASSFTRAQKRVAIVNGPDYIRRKVADQLSNRVSRANLTVFERSEFSEFAANVNFLSLRNLASNELLAYTYILRRVKRAKTH